MKYKLRMVLIHEDEIDIELSEKELDKRVKDAKEDIAEDLGILPSEIESITAKKIRD